MKNSQIDGLKPTDQNAHTVSNQVKKTSSYNDLKKLLYTQFEEQSIAHPSNIAVIYDGLEITYAELYKKVTFLSDYLNTLSVSRNTLVAILLPKSEYQIIAALGILKAGAAYLPINIHESKERKQALLKQGEVTVVLTSNSMMEELPWLVNYITIPLDLFFSRTSNTFVRDATRNKAVEYPLATSSDLAYVLFTSGSTGTPKGVMISHANAVNTIEDINQRFHVIQTDKILALSSLDFDLSVYDIFGLLSVGGTIIIPTEEQMAEPKKWLDLIESHKITLWNTVPGFMEILVRCIKLQNLKNNSQKTLLSLRLILLSGDWIRVQLPGEIRHCCPNADIISLGGATEASIWSIVYPINVNQINKDWKSIPYGTALKNQSFYILDVTQAPVQNDEEGELYIGGQGVGVGYWNDATNTQYHFIQHPNLGYLYRTGDKGKWLSDGNILFLGRVGEQVKLRGFRIDLKAIESCIESIPEVTRCVTKIIKSHDVVDNLIAFVECKNLIDYLINNFETYHLLVTRHLSYWKKIYNDLFETNEISPNPHFNTAGWISSYSRSCIPEYQMKEWLDTTVSRILDCNPKRVLDVGVGTGLLLAEIAPHVSVYDALDTSRQALLYIEKYFQKEDKYQHVRCLKNNISSLDENYDTVILNSVVQYFPDVAHLDDMLDQLVNKTISGGKIFLGDIYNYEYLEDFHVSVQLQHQSPTMPGQQFCAVLKKLIAKESELFIHPQFFIEYAKGRSRITQVEIQLKAGLSHNELNGFRYDVVFSIDTLPSDELNVVSIEGKSFLNVESLRKYLSEHQNSNVVVNHLPNVRLIGLSQFQKLKEDKNVTVANIRQAVYQQTHASMIDPYDCYQLGKQLGYQVSCRWSLDKYYFDVVFYKQQNPFAYHCTEKTNQKQYFFHYANTPLQHQFQRFVEQTIRDRLSANLAPYMQPHEIIFMNDVPFTANGKVNYKELLALADMIAPEEESKYLQPMSALEEQLVEIYKQVLNLRQVNTSKGFIQLGGDSLMMLEATHEIEKHCLIHITIGELIANPSIRELAQYLGKKMMRK